MNLLYYCWYHTLFVARDDIYYYFVLQEISEKMQAWNTSVHYCSTSHDYLSFVSNPFADFNINPSYCKVGC